MKTEHKDDTLKITLNSNSSVTMHCPHCLAINVRSFKDQEWALTICYSCNETFWYKQNGHTEEYFSYLNLPK